SDTPSLALPGCMRLLAGLLAVDHGTPAGLVLDSSVSVVEDADSLALDRPHALLVSVASTAEESCSPDARAMFEDAAGSTVPFTGIPPMPCALLFCRRDDLVLTHFPVLPFALRPCCSRTGRCWIRTLGPCVALTERTYARRRCSRARSGSFARY